MPDTSAQSIAHIVEQHAEESANLRTIRSLLVAAPHVRLGDLARHDKRLAAHLDGLAVAGDYGRSVCQAALEDPGIGEVFTATVRAIEDRNTQGLEKLFALVTAVPQSQPGFVSAFGWVSAQFLQGTIRNLLVSSDPFHRQTGIAACAMHQVDLGVALVKAVADTDARLRAYALRAAGETGRCDLLEACLGALNDTDAACRFAAASSAVLLGDRNVAIDGLKEMALRPGPGRIQALRLVLKCLDASQPTLFLKALAADPANIRLLIHGAGIAGDPHFVPWLIKQMEDPKLARLAGESFCFVTGLYLDKQELNRNRPEGFESGPSDDPDDPDVAMDPDDNLPWPDPAKLGKWWGLNSSRFSVGERYFMGGGVNQQNCGRVLREGYQRQRIAAAEHLCLLQPGTPLFQTSAPAWRQQRWLRKMG